MDIQKIIEKWRGELIEYAELQHKEWDKVFMWNISFLKELLQSEIERKKRMIIKLELEPVDIHESGRIVGYNQAITEDIEYLTNILNNL